jgi:uncharacterized protein YjdB
VIKPIHLVAVTLLASCAVDDLSLSTDTQDLLGGTLSNTVRPEVVRFVRTDGLKCTATMLSSTTFLTSAGCIQSQPVQFQGTLVTASGQTFGVDKTFSQGAVYKNDDLAVGRIVEPMNVTPATISTREPSHEELTAVGYGCIDNVEYCSHHGRDFREYRYDGASTNIETSDDDGGPTFIGFVNDNGPIVRVASGKSVSFFNGETDLGSDPVAYRSQINALSAALINPGISYRSQVQSLGWTAAVSNGAMSGTTQNLRLEGLQVWTGNPFEQICYTAFVEGQWQSMACDGMLAGTVGQSKRMQAIMIDRKIRGIEWPIRYRTFTQAYGWMPWVENNSISGAATSSIEAIQIELLVKIVLPPGGGSLE